MPVLMSFIACQTFGAPEVLVLASRPLPVVGEGEVRIKVAAAGVNRADLLQRRGKYPQPSGASDILGLEVAGVVESLGAGADRWRVGDRVCALLAGGGYAEYVTVPALHCLPVPEALSLTEAAALPEALVTVYANLCEAGGLKPGDNMLIHGGSSGIGTTAIQWAKHEGARVLTTVGSQEKAEACLKLGADLAIAYKQEDFVERVLSATSGRGVDIVLDMIGGAYVNRNLTALALGGRHISIATQSGALAEIDIRLVMQKRLILTGSTLRGRDRAEKSRLIAAIEAKIWSSVASGKIKPVIYQTFPLKNASQAHKALESGAHIGKIVLEVS